MKSRTWWPLRTRASVGSSRCTTSLRFPRFGVESLEERVTPDVKVYASSNFALPPVATYSGATALNDAINNATTVDGDYVVVDTTGTDTYNAPQTISKSLTILGPNAAISPNTGSRVPEVFIDTTPWASNVGGNIAIGDGKTVSIRGFSFTSPTGKGAITTFAEHYSLDFGFNIVKNQTPVFGVVYVSNSATDGFTNVNITDNLLQNNAAGIQGIRISRGSSATVTNNVVIGGFFGIGLNASTDGPVNDRVVTNNYVQGTTQSGIVIGDFVTNPVVEYNTVVNANTSNTSHQAGIRINAYVSAANPGPRGAVDVSHNLITGSNTGLTFGTYGNTGAPLPDLAAVSIQENSITANAGTTAFDTGSLQGATTASTLNLSGNWVGVNAAAAVQGQISGNRPAVIEAYLSGGANTVPSSVNQFSGTHGFNPDVTAVEMWVPQHSATSGLPDLNGVIQTGIDRAVDQMTVRVFPDTFSENLTVPAGRSLTLVGSTPGGATVNGNLTATGGTPAAFLKVIDLATGGGSVSGYGNVTFGSTSANPGTYTVTGSSFDRAGDQTSGPFALSGIGTLTVNGGSGADQFNVTPAAAGGTAIVLNGGLPTPGDVLTLSAAGATTPTISGPVPTGTFAAADRQTVNWTGIEQVLGAVGAISVFPSAGNNFRLVRNGANFELYNIDAYTPTQQLILAGAAAPPAGAAAITSFGFTGSAAISNQLWVDLTAGNAVPSGGISFAGNPGDADRVYVVGNGTGTATYTASGTTPGAGAVNTGGGTIQVSGLTGALGGVDLTGFTAATVALPNGSIAATANGASYAAVPTTAAPLVANAVRVTGTAGPGTLANVSVSATPSVTLSLAAGASADAATLGGDFGAAGATLLTVNAGNGTVSQSGPVSVSQLELLGGASYTLTDAKNQVSTVAGNVTNAVSVASAADITVGTAGGTTGLTATGALSLTTPGNLTVGAPVSGASVALSFGQSGAGSTALVNAPISGSPASLTGGAGADAITVNATAAGQTLTVNGAGGGDTYTVNYGNGTGTVAVADTGAAGTATLNLNGTAGADTIEVNTATAGAGAVAVGGETVTYTATLKATNVDGKGGADVYNVQFVGLPPALSLLSGGKANFYGTTGADTFDVNNATANAVGLGTEQVKFTSALTGVSVFGLDGNDTFNLAPSATIPLTVDGGNPVNVTPGDTLNINLAGVTNPLLSSPAVPDGSLTSSNRMTVNWVSIESGTPAATPPTISPIPNQTTTVGVPVGPISFTVTDTQTPPANIVVTASSSDQSIVPNGNITLGGSGSNRTITVTPLPGQTGTVTITLTATNDAGLTSTQTFTVAVNPVTPPTLSPISNQTTTEGVPVGPIAFTVNDATTPPGNVVVTATSSNQTLIPNGNITLGGNGSNRTITITPAGTQTGTATITLTATNDAGLSTSETFTVTVNPTGAPTISPIGNQTTAPGQTVGPIGFTIGDDNTPPGSLTVTATSDNQALVPNGNIVLGGSGANRTITITPVQGAAGTATITVTVTDSLGVSSVRTFTVTVPNILKLPQDFAVGPTAGSSPVVTVYGPDGSKLYSVTAFDAGFTGGVRVAMADFNGDGVPDLVIGTGPGVPTRVQVLDGSTKAVLFDVQPFEASFTGGVYVAAGDITGDGRAELVITPDEGGGPRVRVFNGNGFAVVADFFGIDDPSFRGGARAAVGDVNGDGIGDLIVAAGFQGGPRVAGFSGQSVSAGNPRHLFGDFFAFESTLRNGVFLAVGDVNGDGFADVIAGGGPGGGPRVSAFDGKTLLANVYNLDANFFGGDPTDRGGSHLAVKDLDGDNRADIVVGARSGADSLVSGFPGSGITPTNTPLPLFDFETGAVTAGGVYVG